MTTLTRNNFGDLVAVCPYCNSHVVLQLQIIDLHIYPDFKNKLNSITLKKTISQKPENEIYLKNLLINSLKKKPFIARVIITKPYFDIINELTKIGYLTNKDLDKIKKY